MYYSHSKTCDHWERGFKTTVKCYDYGSAVMLTLISFACYPAKFPEICIPPGKASENTNVAFSPSPHSPSWRTANRPWFCFPSRSLAWTRAWWSPAATAGLSAPAAKSPGRAAQRRSRRGGDGPSRRRRKRRRKSAVPSASASPSMPTPSTSTPGPCSLSLSPWWTWSTGWHTPCEEQAAGLCQWLPSRTVYKKLLELCHFNAVRLVRLKYTARRREKEKYLRGNEVSQPVNVEIW